MLRRQGRKAETVRLGGWNEAAYGSSVPYNFAGYAVADRAREAELILWNLACEGTTVVDDQRWVWFIKMDVLVVGIRSTWTLGVYYPSGSSQGRGLAVVDPAWLAPLRGFGPTLLLQ